jgi:hypothetical protein
VQDQINGNIVKPHPWKLVGTVFMGIFVLGVAIGSLGIAWPKSQAIVILFWILNLPAGVALWVLGTVFDCFLFWGNDQGGWSEGIIFSAIFSSFSAVCWASLVMAHIKMTKNAAVTE